MVKSEKSALAWALSFILNLFRLAPFYVFSSVWTSLFSQACQVLAFLLPLKIMILIGSDTTPKYFPDFFISFERDHLILSLSATAILLYIFHLLGEIAGRQLSQKGSKRLIISSCKEEEFGRQCKVALSLYRGGITIIGGLSLTLAVMIFFGFTYLFILFALLVFFAFAFILCSLFFYFSPISLNNHHEQLGRVIDILSGCGFLLVFSALVASFLYDKPENLLLGILALMLCRQMFSRLAIALKSFVYLYAHREKSALALCDQPEANFSKLSSDDFEKSLENISNPKLQLDILTPPDFNFRATIASEERLNFWTVISPDYTTVLARKALTLANIEFDDLRFKQLEAGQCRELALALSCVLSGELRKSYLLRILGHKEAAVQERAVRLLEYIPRTVAVKLLSVVEWDGFTGALYEWDAKAVQVDSQQQILLFQEQAFIELACKPIPKSLSESLSETLVERCEAKLWSWCKAFSHFLDADTQSLILGFKADPGRLQQALGRLPKYLYNPDIRLGNVYFMDNGLKALNWENWALEPIGSGWPLELGWERLEMAFELVCERNANLRDISFTQLRLAALAFAFEARCAQGLYLSAFRLLPELRATLDAVD